MAVLSGGLLACAFQGDRHAFPWTTIRVVDRAPGLSDRPLGPLEHPRLTAEGYQSAAGTRRGPMPPEVTSSP